MLAGSPSQPLPAAPLRPLSWYIRLQVELQEVVDFFTKPKLFRSSGARIPKGVLLCGPPGADPNP